MFRCFFSGERHFCAVTPQVVTVILKTFCDFLKNKKDQKKYEYCVGSELEKDDLQFTIRGKFMN